jgi:hypothetical protein
MRWELIRAQHTVQDAQGGNATKNRKRSSIEAVFYSTIQPDLFDAHARPLDLQPPSPLNNSFVLVFPSHSPRLLFLHPISSSMPAQPCIAFTKRGNTPVSGGPWLSVA